VHFLLLTGRFLNNAINLCNIVTCCTQVYGLLNDEFKQGLHALSMTLKTPAEKEKQ